MSPRSDQTSLVLPFPRERRLAVTPGSATSLLPVLIVLHQETSTPGRVGNALRALGHPLDIRRPRFGDALPETLDEHAGAVIFGGPMSANDGDEYLRREIDWIEIPLREQRPFLGICLGAQMLARQLGAPVAPHPEGRVEGRLLSDPADRGWPRALPELAGSRLSLARRGLSIACRLRAACRGR
jgi:GMP synthase (glutamine-hydrolysing)